MLALGNFNQDLLMRKAMLRGSDMKQIEKFEEQYLTQLYGDDYAKLKHMQPIPRLYKLYDMENKIVLQLMR